MHSCWSDHPKDRPSFSSILKTLESIYNLNDGIGWSVTKGNISNPSLNRQYNNEVLSKYCII